MPHLQSVYHDLKDRGFTIVAIDVGDDSAAEIRSFVSQNGITFPVVADDAAAHKAMTTAQRYGVEGTPSNFLVDSAGRSLAHYDVVDEAELRQALGKAGITKA